MTRAMLSRVSKHTLQACEKCRSLLKRIGQAQAQVSVSRSSVIEDDESNYSGIEQIGKGGD